MKSIVSVYPQPTPTARASPASEAPHAPTATWPGYSPTKFLALHDYCASASRRRVAAVLLCTPIPALLGSLLPSLVVLEDPLLGFEANHSALLHGFVFVFLASVGVIAIVLGGASIPRAQYPEVKVLLVAFAATIPVSAITYVPCIYWRFPVPFLILLSSPVWTTMIVITHAVLLRSTFQRFPDMPAAVTKYKVAMFVQSSQLGIYAALTILFDRLSTVYQILMVAIFPMVKFGLKRILRKHTKALEETSAEITISTVEICASMYQAMIMQTSPSTLTMIAIMGFDLVQAIVSVKFFMGRHMTTSKRDAMARTTALLERYRGLDLASFASKLSKEELVIVHEGLALASAAERVLLVEYYEVSVPIVSSLFLLASYKSTSTLYNTRLNRFYDNTDLVIEATTSVLLYSLLQGVSLVLFHIVLRRRHNMSALYHVAFVLEYHWRSIHGKLLVFFTIIFYFTLMHYGADFTLQFDFAKLMKAMPVQP